MRDGSISSDAARPNTERYDGHMDSFYPVHYILNFLRTLKKKPLKMGDFSVFEDLKISDLNFTTRAWFFTEK